MTDTPQTDFLTRLLAGLVAALLVAALVPDSGPSTLLVNRIQDSGHVLLGAALAWLLYRIATPRLQRFALWRRFMLIGLLSGAVLALVEIIQLPLQRDASVMDLLLGLLGAAGAVLLLQAARTPARAQKRLLMICGLVSLLLALLPLAVTVAAYAARKASFPELVRFDSRLDAVLLDFNRARLERGQAVVAGGERFPVSLCFQTGPFPGISIVEPVKDWSGYRRLQASFYSGLSYPVGLVLRVHDRQHNQAYSDRYNRRLELQPGVNRFTISLDEIRRAPAGRDMDMQAISGMMLFVPSVKQPLCLYPGRMRLIAASN